MLMRQSFPVVRHVPKVFQNIARCRVANSIDEAREMKILRAGDGITMNRSRLLADAKERCLRNGEGLLAARGRGPCIFPVPCSSGSSTARPMR